MGWFGGGAATWGVLSGTPFGSYNLTVPTLTANDTLAALGLAQSFTAAQTNLQSISATSTDGWVLSNTTDATADAQKWSPRLRWTGQGWKTNATAGSQTVDMIAELQPIQGAANPTAKLVFSSQVNGGGYTNQFSVSSSGVLTLSGSASNTTSTLTSSTISSFAALTIGQTGNNLTVRDADGGVVAGSSGYFAFSSLVASTATPDLIIRRVAAATLQFGSTNAAAPIAQILQVQSVIGGTTNTAGVDWTHNASKGTGTGAGGKLVFQTAPAGATGTAQNTLVPALTLTAPAQRGGVTQQPSIVLGNAALATADTDGFLYIPTCAGTPTGVPTANTGRVALVYDTTNHQFWIYDGAWLQPKTPAGAALVTWQ